MGIEENINLIDNSIQGIWTAIIRIEAKLDKLLEHQQPKDRQDKEKAIKGSLAEKG